MFTKGMAVGENASRLNRAIGEGTIHSMIGVQHIFIASGHSFFGRHDQPPAPFPFREVAEVECVAGCGLRGDRFFNYKPDYKGQITFFSREVFARMQAELGLGRELAAGNTRRNVITAGVELNSLIGQEFAIQGVRFLGAEECRPCEWMNEAFGNPRAEEWLRGHGGLSARILSSGVLRRDS